MIKGNNPRAKHAAAICWIESFAGYLHQPLHAVSMYTRKVPSAVRGSNETIVRFAPKATITLHKVCDGLLGSNSKYNPVPRIATELLAGPVFLRGKMPEILESGSAKCAKKRFEVAERVENSAFSGNTGILRTEHRFSITLLRRAASN